MNKTNIPTLEEFLVAPVEEVAKVAPVTAVYGAGGTRRRAVFEGIEPWSDEFVKWARVRIFSRINMLFRHGIQNLFVTTLTPDNFREVNRYQEQLLERTHWFIAGAESLADYECWNWRVRLVGAENLPVLSNTAQYLHMATPEKRLHTLYWNIVPTIDSPWQQLLAATQRSQAQNRTEVIRALYGEDIPLITLYLGFGKTTILPEIVPPILMGQVQSYWSQQPGYTLTETQLRTILYDYAYLRPTWREEKLERAKEAIVHRHAWEQGPILGLGMRLGPFWYPAPTSSSAWPTE
jgi:hypothetical protein